MEVGRPSQKSQPSRKGKKAWRKNIDIDDISRGLEEKREVERFLGTSAIQDTGESAIFSVDTAGDSSIVAKRDREAKRLKSEEILARRSAVPALNAIHKKKDGKIQGVSGKEINRLMRVAGREGDSSAKATIEKDGIIHVEAYDLWGEPTENAKNNKKLHSFLKDINPATSYTPATVVPPTLAKNPISLVDKDESRAVVVPEEGKSYNPSLEAWKALVQKEADKEQERENERQKLAEQKARIEELMEKFDENEEIGDEVEDEEELDDGPVNAQLSVNDPVKVKTKTKAQRRKQQRHQEKLQLQDDLKRLKQQIRDLETLPKLLRQEEDRIKQQEQEEDKLVNTVRKRKKKLGKYMLKEGPLEVKLSDELTDCLRRLKSEGNLTVERFKSLQARGLIEVRVPVSRKRRYKPKLTEKWSYKDFK
jgi:nucleolar protein 53